ncbi:DUF58 domain-containing protein [Thermostilla marina]
MPGSKRFLHPETLRRIARLELRAKQVVEGFLSGMHASPYTGNSVEFLQHRQYAPGDDPRHVDWKVWARQDRLYVKQFREDTNLRCLLVVDVSASMQYGSGPLNKYEYACTLASSLAYLLLRQQDAVGLLAIDESVRASVPVRSKRSQLEMITQALDVSVPAQKTEIYQNLIAAVDHMPGRGLVVLVSDLLIPREGLFRGLQGLRAKGHDVVVFHVLDDDELEFRLSGPTRFESLETDEVVPCDARSLREGYLQELRKYLEEVRRGCARGGVDYTLVRTGEPLDAALAAFLSYRMSAIRRS